jgi:lipopolysaccharide transport system permease protein
MTDTDELIIEPASKFSLNLKELWRYRELFYFFTWRDIKVKYKQTVLGFLWVILQPIIMMLIFNYFFGRMLGIGVEGIPYPVFVLSGIILWNFFSSCVNNAGNSMVSNATIIKKIYFPRLIIPISSMLAALVDLCITFVLFLVFVFLYNGTLEISALYYWPLGMALTILGSLGIGCGVSALMVKYRDFRFIIPFALQAAFFITPIVYQIKSLKFPMMEYVMALNPMYGAIALFREPLISGSTTLDWGSVTISILSSISVFIIGLSYFRKTELFFADLA